MKHFDRLQLESRLPAFLVYHVANGEAEHPSADLVVTEDAIRKSCPRRALQRARAGKRINQGYVDLVFVTAATNRKFAAFDYFWILEADVDYAGVWSDFFAHYENSQSDLLATQIRGRSDDPDWFHWRWFKAPPNFEQVVAFIPAGRLSRRLLKAYVKETRKKLWGGHYEAIFPTVALAYGMGIEDMRASGQFSRGPENAPVDDLSFGYRPFRAESYFHEDPQAFPAANMLYHPVKAFD